MTELKDLSPEQRQVVESWGQGLAVMAGAGAGKTTTLVIKCVELLKRKPEAKFAAVSFTERSASDLREKLSSRIPLDGHWVMTIHGLCGSIIRDFPREAGFDGEETMLSETESQLLWERAMDSIWTEDLPGELLEAVERLLTRESRDSLMGLLRRVRDLHLFGVLDSLRRSDDPSAQGLAVVGEHVLSRYDRLKRRRGALDFNDLEAGADRALEHSHVREAFQKRFELVLVDEFQDTNPVQARIIWRFVRSDASNLCVVGDPKQSIYRFRDADVSVFEDLCSRLPTRLSLTWNFRSRPGIIEFANQVCLPLFEASEMTYEALVPKREPSNDHPPVVRVRVSTPAQLAQWVRGEMERGVPLHEMALLLRKIRGNEKWLKALTSAGIPIAVGSGGLFWEDPRVREMTALLKWWDQPASSLSGAVFLRAPWVGVSDALLDQWVRKDPTLTEPFFASSHPLAERLRPFRGKCVRPGELLMALLATPAIEEELGAPLLGLWHRAEDLSARGLDFHSVVRELSTAMAESRRERDVPPPRNQGQLVVLTLHGSKGLEFPHVILIDFAEKPARGSDAPLLFWDREQGAFLGGRSEDGDREKDHPIEAAWRLQEKKKALAESKRVFYVALTRARERLVLVCPETTTAAADATAPAAPEKKSRAKSVVETPYDKDHWRGWIEALGETSALVELPRFAAGQVPAAVQVSKSEASRLVRISSSPAKPTLQIQRPRHSVTEWTTLSRCERAYEWTYIRPIAVVEGIPEIGLFTGARIAGFSDQELTQRELGTRVHACLETGDYDGLKAIEEEAGPQRFLAEPVVSWALSSPLMAPASEEQGRWVYPELAFEVPVGREVLVGSLDRLVVERGRYFIVDFKVTEKIKSVEGLLEAYQTQLQLYAWALEKLEPEARGKTEALLVNISARTVQTVPVPLGTDDPDSVFAARLAERSVRIVSGEAGRARVGPLCRVCEFRSQCPEGLRSSLT